MPCKPANFFKKKSPERYPGELLIDFLSGDKQSYLLFNLVSVIIS
jgi:hypothetical protein